jgi:hypothetical protein
VERRKKRAHLICINKNDLPRLLRVGRCRSAPEQVSIAPAPASFPSPIEDAAAFESAFDAWPPFGPAWVEEPPVRRLTFATEAAMGKLSADGRYRHKGRRGRSAHRYIPFLNSVVSVAPLSRTWRSARAYSRRMPSA